MAYDEALARRIRGQLGRLRGITEKRMMGGLCLLVHGNMLCGIDRTRAGKDRLMFRVGKAQEAEALARAGTSIVEMGGRRMGGFVFADARSCDADSLATLMRLSLAYVRALPRK